MEVEIDQSGKIGDTKIATVLAFSNDISYSIYISAVTKRKLIQTLRSLHNSRVFYFHLFAILIFILLKDFLDKIQSIYIDQEYVGREDQIKVYLITTCIKYKVNIDPDSIHFIHIGKESPAHARALQGLKTKKADRKVSFEEIASYFLPNKKGSGFLP